MLHSKYLLLSFLFLLGVITPEKEVTGEVEYTISLRTPDLDNLGATKKLSDEINEKVKALHHNSQNVTAVLYFNKTISVYRLRESLDNEAKGMNITKTFAGNENVYYHNSVNKQNILETNSLGKLFLVTSPSPKWELTKETKELSGYICRKAILRIQDAENQKDENRTTAWFTTDLPVNHGPMNYNALPGLILELQTNKLNIRAKKIKLDSAIPDIEMPREGERVTKLEYERIARKIIPGFFEN